MGIEWKSAENLPKDQEIYLVCGVFAYGKQAFWGRAVYVAPYSWLASPKDIASAPPNTFDQCPDYREDPVAGALFYWPAGWYEVSTDSTAVKLTGEVLFYTSMELPKEVLFAMFNIPAITH